MVEQTTKGAISPSTGRTLPDRYIEGICPICGYPHARGDQCDNCGNQLDATDLIEPHSRINGEVPEFIETEHFFLDLPALAEALGEWLHGKEAEGLWRPNVLKFSLNLLEDLRPRAMTRDIDWGIPVPLPGWEDNPTKRLYVWFDAVIGYLSAVDRVGPARRRPGGLAALVERPGRAVLLLHGQGQHHLPRPDLAGRAARLRRQGLARRRAGTVRRPGPADRGRVVRVPDHGGQAVLLQPRRRDLRPRRARAATSPTPCGTSSRPPARRTRTRTSPGSSSSGGPTTSSWPAGATWSTGPRRLIHKNLGAIPEAGDLTDDDRALLAAGREAFGVVGGLIERHRQKQALGEAMRFVGEANKYLSDQAPWKLKTTDPDRMATVLHVAAQAVSDARTLLSPFLPFSAQRVHEVMGGTGVVSPMPEIREVEDLDGGPSYPVLMGDYSAFPAWESVPVVPGTPIAAPTPVFTKLDAEAVVRDELARLEQAASSDVTNERRSMSAGWPPAPEPLPLPVVDDHCHLDIPAATRDEAAEERSLDEALDSRGGGQRAPRRPGRLRRRQLALVGRGGDHPPAAAGRRRPAPQRGAPARRAGRARRGVRRDRGARGPPAGAGDRRDRPRHLPDRPGRGGRPGGVVPLAHRPGQAHRARRCRSTTGTRTPTCCGSWPRRGRPSGRSCTASPVTPRWPASAYDAATCSRSPARSPSATPAALREAVAVAPLDLLQVETDAPYLTPTPHRGRPNAQLSGAAHGAGHRGRQGLRPGGAVRDPGRDGRAALRPLVRRAEGVVRPACAGDLDSPDG